MSNIAQVPASPANYTPGRLGYRVVGIIIHTIVGSLASAGQAFQNPARQASAHYGVACDGSVIDQYVAESNIAWHCGRFYSDAADPLANCNTVGIEHCDDGQAFAPRSDAEYAASAQLVREVAARYGIPIDRAHIRKHSEVSVAPTGCPDTLDINRIVEMAAGRWGVAPDSITGDDDMLFVGPFHAVAGTVKAFVAVDTYSDPSTASLKKGQVAIGANFAVVGYRFSSSAVQSTDLDGHGLAGPDLVWWKLSDGRWAPDADLDTTSVAGIPQGTALSNFPAGESPHSYFVSVDQAGTQGTPGPIGPTGPQGPTGPAGPPGPAPKSATFPVMVTF